jgi:hypothetical protein
MSSQLKYSDKGSRTRTSPGLPETRGMYTTSDLLGLVRAWSSEKRSANGREKNWRLVSPFQLGESNLFCRGSEACTPHPSFICSYETYLGENFKLSATKMIELEDIQTRGIEPTQRHHTRALPGRRGTSCTPRPRYMWSYAPAELGEELSASGRENNLNKPSEARYTTPDLLGLV